MPSCHPDHRDTTSSWEHPVHPCARQHSLLRAPGLGLAIQVDKTQEMNAELEHNREDSVGVEDIRQGPLPGEGLEGLQWQDWGQAQAYSGAPCLPPSSFVQTAVTRSW